MTFLKIAAGFLTFLLLWTLVETVRGDRSLPLGKRAWKAWLKVGHTIGSFNSRLILTIFYWLIIMPYALIMKFTHDSMRTKGTHGWLARETKDLTLKDASRQF